MPNQEYFFQQKQNTFAQKFFENGFSAASYILLTLKEHGEGFLASLPGSYPEFAFWQKAFEVGKYKKPEFKKHTLKINFYRLEKQGLIVKDPEEKAYVLTDEGKSFVTYVKDRYLILKEKWDEKFRIVVFDIPDTKKDWRKWLVRELTLLQYKMLQKSVYIGKYPLPQSFYEEVAKANLVKDIFILTIGEVDRIEDILKLWR